MTDKKANKKLAELLEKLNNALETLDSTDEKSRKKLSQLIKNINLKLGKPEHNDDDAPLADQLKDTVVHFEVSHPAITDILNQIKLALYSMGL
jgi:hypothetical protein